MKKLIIEVVVGYMLKVMKNNMELNQFRNEFNAIRHGNYNEFLNQIDKRIDYIVTYNAGYISNNVDIEKGDFTIAKLVKSAAALKDFYARCKSEFGDFKDEHYTDDVFEELALFEISLRVHFSNQKKEDERIKLEELINKFDGLNEEEKSILHEGRRFLNDVKHKRVEKSLERFTSFKKTVEMINRKQLSIRLVY